ncbi:hypothetical protein BDZ89DRAFT_1035152 [Hymenopellis radicata]|nr:hypothetical protein BDZ89DRAFT_1035152 [Hymenopellis radicata]
MTAGEDNTNHCSTGDVGQHHNNEWQSGWEGNRSGYPERRRSGRAQCLEPLNIFTNGDDAEERVEHAADNCEAGGFLFTESNDTAAATTTATASMATTTRSKYSQHGDTTTWTRRTRLLGRGDEDGDQNGDLQPHDMATDYLDTATSSPTHGDREADARMEQDSRSNLVDAAPSTTYTTITRGRQPSARACARVARVHSTLESERSSIISIGTTLSNDNDDYCSRRTLRHRQVPCHSVFNALIVPCAPYSAM